MKSWLIALSVALAGAGMSLAPSDADARRLGGGRPAGLQRQTPPPQPAQPPAATTPSQGAQGTPGVNQAAPVAGAAATGAAAANAGKRSWAGPIAGIAAGLGIAALLSHFGLGEAFANLLTMLLLAAAGFFVLRFVMRRVFGHGMASGAPGRLSPAAAGPGSTSRVSTPDAAPWQRAPLQRHDALHTDVARPASSGSSAVGVTLPPDVDAQAFERIAKMIFIRLQAANDAGAVDDLRRFTTPELFASLRLDLQERGASAQQTDVVQLDAEILDATQDAEQWVVSVRFHGLIREDVGGVAEPFDEVWHLVRPIDASREWAIAGITPVGAAA